jgi:hypothetical protein
MLPKKTLALVTLTLVTAAACSSSSSGGNASGDGGSSGGDASATANSAACDALVAFQQRCGEDAYSTSAACATGRKQNCSGTLAVFTPTFQAAIAACDVASTTCDNGPGSCYDTQLASVQPTAAQAKVRDDYCKGCPAVPSCTSSFFTIDPTNGDGPGVGVLEVTDAIAAQIDATCTGTALLDAGEGTDCTTSFGSCVADVVVSAQPGDPDVCYPPSSDDGGAEDAGEDGGPDAGQDAGALKDASTNG